MITEEIIKKAKEEKVEEQREKAKIKAAQLEQIKEQTKQMEIEKKLALKEAMELQDAKMKIQMEQK